MGEAESELTDVRIQSPLLIFWVLIVIVTAKMRMSRGQRTFCGKKFGREGNLQKVLSLPLGG